MKTSDFVEKQWRASIWFLKIFPFFILLIVVINIWHDADQGKPFDWMHIVYGIGFLFFTCVLYVFMRLIFKFVRAKVQHDERRS
ncbi:hypothetical protein [Sphingopyxis alaskensis]|jgi:hypothetical protein|uniref:Uncharacterized protein n=1 Tax=Sphingopyxis alaskensis (strain DSM 13593 / LMG 18877 / RB2256) TaxID=317655 RepID=Q1GTA0_SPHAL|nr:hypothetical protein [Sphingopyxis alaskensis]ABF53122.1 hypothetical protein Sala_1408 [Sphingopyxis alaskensis RB2256]MCM3420486.1 hypothetical protein [Sphingopyxis alaskensis]